MEATQATAPAQAQAQQPVHPVHEETATLNALTQWVSETPDNDPHAGTDLEAPKTQTEAPQDTQAEEKPEETVEFDEETPFFDLEYKTEGGVEKKKLSAKEIREGWLAKQDYHRNIQKVKQQESEIQQRTQQAELQAIQQYAQRVELHQQAIQRLAGVKSMAEIEALAKEDPAGAQQEFLRFINVNQTMQSLEAEKQAALGKQQQAIQAARQRAIEHARQTLESDVPNWSADLYNKVLGGVSSDYGFKKEEVEQVIDARLVKVFHDAYQFRQLQKAKPEISKRVVAVPKVVKPGSGEKPNPAKEQANDSFQRLKKTGRIDDAVQAYLSRQKQK
jgi:hypothetical protein